MCESEPNGAGLSIRRMNEGDADALYGVLSDPEIMKYLEPPYSREATVQFLHDAGMCERPLVWAVDDASYIISMTSTAWSWAGCWRGMNGARAMPAR